MISLKGASNKKQRIVDTDIDINAIIHNNIIVNKYKK